MPVCRQSSPQMLFENGGNCLIYISFQKQQIPTKTNYINRLVDDVRVICIYF